MVLNVEMAASDRPRISHLELKINIAGERKMIAALRAALSPEADSGKRCKMSLHTSQDKESLSMLLSSNDIVSLRAGFNTDLRLAAASVRNISAVRAVSLAKDLQKDSINQVRKQGS